MLRSGFATVSDGFVAYLKTDIEPLVSQFYSKNSNGGLQRVHKAAGSLLSILRDEVSLEKERRLHLHTTTDAEQYTGPTQLPTPATSPANKTWAQLAPVNPRAGVPATPLVSGTLAVPRNGGLPTPTTSPANKTWAQLAPVTPRVAVTGLP